MYLRINVIFVEFGKFWQNPAFIGHQGRLEGHQGSLAYAVPRDGALWSARRRQPLVPLAHMG